MRSLSTEQVLKILIPVCLNLTNETRCHAVSKQITIPIVIVVTSKLLMGFSHSAQCQVVEFICILKFLCATTHHSQFNDVDIFISS